MPTVALMNGHAFAGGFMMAMHHDYRVMSPSRGFACLNELEFGAPLKAAMSGIFRLKVPAATYRSIVLEARRFPGPEALAAGIVDATGGVEEVLKLVAEKKLTTKGATGVYGVLKAEMYRESIGYLTVEGHEREEEKEAALMSGEDERKETGSRWVEEWKVKGKL